MNFKRCIVIIIIFIVGLFFNLPAGAVDNIIPLPQDSSTFLGKIDTIELKKGEPHIKSRQKG